MDDYNQDFDYAPKRKHKKFNKTGYFLSGLAGVIVGALLVGFLFPNLGNDDGNTSFVQPKNKQTMSVDITTSVTAAYKKAADAVVGITNIQEATILNQGGAAGTGSGVVYKKENGKAFIITNHHVIEGATTLEVSLTDGTKVPAKILGSDIWTDLAVIQIDAKDVKTVAEFGDSDALKPGEPVIAIGNPLGLQFSGSVTQGIISGLERTIEIDINEDGVVDWNAEVLQTDAAINPGNSGGALVNMDGQLVGINSMKIAEQAVEGIGLAIPVNAAIPIVEAIEKYGEVKRPYLGVSLLPLTDVSQYHRNQTLHLPADVKEGIAITNVEPNSPAARGGIKLYDVIVEMDGEKINDMASFRTHLYEKKKIGDTLEIKLYRNGKAQTIKVTLQGETL
ncbi:MULTISPECIES: S1C family serine protease [Bacillus]|uniref:S1C family serine protease n=1 Tax=Bacillus TaxID=1386 RepID=UPI000317D6BB|nr:MULTISPECIES: trypsin-like peptidase domain-containing protein [Bacillus]